MNVMKMAWEIARKGAVKFGGKVKEYFAEALKLAWKIVKGGIELTAKLETLTGSRKHKSWVAKIVAKCPTYKFKRAFVNDFEEGGKGKIWTLKDGFYDVCDGGDRKLIQVIDGQIVNVTSSDVEAAL